MPDASSARRAAPAAGVKRGIARIKNAISKSEFSTHSQASDEPTCVASISSTQAQVSMQFVDTDTGNVFAYASPIDCTVTELAAAARQSFGYEREVTLWVPQVQSSRNHNIPAGLQLAHSATVVGNQPVAKTADERKAGHAQLTSMAQWRRVGKSWGIGASARRKRRVIELSLKACTRVGSDEADEDPAETIASISIEEASKTVREQMLGLEQLCELVSLPANIAGVLEADIVDELLIALGTPETTALAGIAALVVWRLAAASPKVGASYLAASEIPSLLDHLVESMVKTVGDIDDQDDAQPEGEDGEDDAGSTANDSPVSAGPADAHLSVEDAVGAAEQELRRAVQEATSNYLMCTGAKAGEVALQHCLGAMITLAHNNADVRIRVASRCSLLLHAALEVCTPLHDLSVLC